MPNDALDRLPQAKLDAISDEYIAKCKSAVERDPKSGSAQANLGEALIFRKQWKPAREAFAAALNLKPRSYEETWYRYRIAETWFGEGKTKSAIAELDRAKAIWAPSGSRYKPNWCRLAADASVFLSGNDLDFYRTQAHGRQEGRCPDFAADEETLRARLQVGICRSGVSPCRCP